MVKDENIDLPNMEKAALRLREQAKDLGTQPPVSLRYNSKTTGGGNRHLYTGIFNKIDFPPFMSMLNL